MTLGAAEREDPGALRAAIRRGDWSGPTAGLVPGVTQANLVVLPAADAFDFLRFCVRNPPPCPVLEVTDPGSPEPAQTAPGADLRTDVPRYRVLERGELVDEPTDVREHWRDDLVAFLLGCSFTFERALLAAGLPVRHIEQGVNVPMYRTTRECVPAGRFAGPLVVSMRPMRPEQAERARRGHAAVLARARGARPRRRPRRPRHRRSRPPRLRRRGRAPRRRGASVLGLRRDAAGGSRAQPAGPDDHPRARPHVRHRRGRTRPGALSTRAGGRDRYYSTATKSLPWVSGRKASAEIAIT